MKDLKMLTLMTITIIMILLSRLSFTQDFPVNITANVAESSPQYILKVDGHITDSIRFDLGEVTLGNIKKRNKSFQIFKGNKNITLNDPRPELKSFYLKDKIGISSISTFADDINTAIIIKLKFQPISAGIINQSTTLVVRP